MKRFQVTVWSVFLAIFCMMRPVFALEVSAKAHAIQKSEHNPSKKNKKHKGLRGSRGHRGKRGHHGHPGSQGAPGSAGLPGTVGPDGKLGQGITTCLWAYEDGGVIIEHGANIQFPHVPTSAGFNALGNGIFESTAGPGTYEVIFGAEWYGYSEVYVPLILYVDGVQVLGGYLDPHRDFEAYSTATVIVSSNEANPQFYIQNGATSSALQLNVDTTHTANPGTGAFITIKKIA